MYGIRRNVVNFILNKIIGLLLKISFDFVTVKYDVRHDVLDYYQCDQCSVGRCSNNFSTKAASTTSRCTIPLSILSLSPSSRASSHHFRLMWNVLKGLKNIDLRQKLRQCNWTLFKKKITILVYHFSFCAVVYKLLSNKHYNQKSNTFNFEFLVAILKEQCTLPPIHIGTQKYVVWKKKNHTFNDHDNSSSSIR